MKVMVKRWLIIKILFLHHGCECGSSFTEEENVCFKCSLRLYRELFVPANIAKLLIQNNNAECIMMSLCWLVQNGQSKPAMHMGDILPSIQLFMQGKKHQIAGSTRHAQSAMSLSLDEAISLTVLFRTILRRTSLQLQCLAAPAAMLCQSCLHREQMLHCGRDK